MEQWGWDSGDGSLGMGGCGWEHGDGSLGMGPWGQEGGDRITGRNALSTFLSPCSHPKSITTPQLRFSNIPIKMIGVLEKEAWRRVWGWEHGDGNMIQWDNGVYSFVLFVICCYLFHSHCMLLRAVFGSVSALFFCCMI